MTESPEPTGRFVRRHEHLQVSRTARYALAGDLEHAPEEVWYALHGYGQLAAEFLEQLAPLQRAGRWFVAPEGLSRFYRKGSSGEVGASWMTRVDREEEIGDTLGLLAAVRRDVERRAAELGEPDRPPRVTLFGFSQGAAAACRWACLAPDPVHLLVSWAGGVPPDLGAAAPQVASRVGALLLVVGTRDPFLRPERLAGERARALALGPPVRLARFEGGHRLDDDLLRRLSEDGAAVGEPLSPPA